MPTNSVVVLSTAILGLTIAAPANAVANGSDVVAYYNHERLHEAIDEENAPSKWVSTARGRGQSDTTLTKPGDVPRSMRGSRPCSRPHPSDALRDPESARSARAAASRPPGPGRRAVGLGH
jgi:hypothetical protein